MRYEPRPKKATRELWCPQCQHDEDEHGYHRHELAQAVSAAMRTATKIWSVDKMSTKHGWLESVFSEVGVWRHTSSAVKRRPQTGSVKRPGGACMEGRALGGNALVGARDASGLLALVVIGAIVANVLQGGERPRLVARPTRRGRS